jgi:SAM-dependent methyltransferase
MKMDNYTEKNAAVIDGWAKNGWEWAQPVSRELVARAEAGDWDVLLTTTRPVPHDWFPPMAGTRVLGLASGGGQQMPIFAALGAECTLLDFSGEQISRDLAVAEREGFHIEAVQADMTKPLPFPDGAFDLIFHPVSNCYVEDVLPIWLECARVLRPGGILMAGLDNGLNQAYGDDERELEFTLPFNPLRDPALYRRCVEGDWGIQFSHTIEEQIGGQLKAGFILTDIYGDINSEGELSAHNIPTFYATRAVKGR